MSEPDKSQSASPFAMSLSKWSTVSAVIPALNERYGLSLDPGAYEDRLAYINETGLLTLEGVNISTGKHDWVVVDAESAQATVGVNEVLDHPKAFAFAAAIKNFSILLNSESELAFLRDAPVDVRYDSGMISDNKSFKLMNLLNNYNIGDGWTSNPSQGCTTAYFTLRYIGSGKDAPSVYNFNPEAKCLAVVELMMYGEYVLYALVVR